MTDPSPTPTPWKACSVVFLGTFAVLLLCASSLPNYYDESLVLTAAMRVAAGQIPHRDFYANYGPAQFYALAGLFKLFAPSILVERLFDTIVKSLLAASVFAILNDCCRRTIAVTATLCSIAWLLNGASDTGTPVVPVSLLNVLSLALILPLFRGAASLSRRRLAAAGALTGLAFLFRYDTGIALVFVHLCVFALAACLNRPSRAQRLQSFAHSAWPFALAFLVIVIPPASYFLAVAPVQTFLHDIILYPGKFYHRERNLPLPFFSGHGKDVGVYLPVILIAIAFYAALRDWPAHSQKLLHRYRRGLLFTFALLGSAMYLKALVRLSLIHLYLSIVPCLILTAVLFAQRQAFPQLFRRFVSTLTAFVILASCLSFLRDVSRLHDYKISLTETLVQRATGRLTPEALQWCQTESPVTRGACFLPDLSHRQAIEFLATHTRPQDTLYVGLAHHDVVFMNDNLIYFATQRLPATHWSHFDPGLQNSLPIQQQIVAELLRARPPYVVLDSEYESIHEPNDSSRSSGVLVLDEFLHQTYRDCRAFGTLNVCRLTS